jgi:hypothetical protein
VIKMKFIAGEGRRQILVNGDAMSFPDFIKERHVAETRSVNRSGCDRMKSNECINM